MICYFFIHINPNIKAQIKKGSHLLEKKVHMYDCQKKYLHVKWPIQDGYVGWK